MYKKNKLLILFFLLLNYSVYSQQSFAQDISLGEKAFNECRACHSLEANVNLIGPSLAGVVNRQIGADTSYRFSKALKSANGIWDVSTLNKFLENPQAVFPGNRMPYSGLSNPAERKALIDYLMTFKP
ncbi:c-type cytochrome [Polynucleobacter kasalickyi]|uniref:Cytochrome c n=1 Tax=Polynucleobacter kasalickyi TaxID=1938817 RepID=A0A1W1Z797_9BURK|nr:c-type cytochrome [Polynucleobacter kasalickyi]SMC44264.1 cytochrome c [Polynucleobacter kasalickyi]